MTSVALAAYLPRAGRLIDDDEKRLFFETARLLPDLPNRGDPPYV
jgi:hypothetical protein